MTQDSFHIPHPVYMPQFVYHSWCETYRLPPKWWKFTWEQRGHWEKAFLGLRRVLYLEAYGYPLASAAYNGYVNSLFSNNVPGHSLWRTQPPEIRRRWFYVGACVCFHLLGFHIVRNTPKGVPPDWNRIERSNLFKLMKPESEGAEA